MIPRPTAGQVHAMRERTGLGMHECRSRLRSQWRRHEITRIVQALRTQVKDEGVGVGKTLLELSEYLLVCEEDDAFDRFGITRGSKECG